jgi:hypothetical protein
MLIKEQSESTASGTLSPATLLDIRAARLVWMDVA